jgi:hypothetical protein
MNFARVFSIACLSVFAFWPVSGWAEEASAAPSPQAATETTADSANTPAPSPEPATAETAASEAVTATDASSQTSSETTPPPTTGETDAKPPSVETFEEAVPAEKENESSKFRFTYPVRDNATTQLFTEEKNGTAAPAASTTNPAAGTPLPNPPAGTAFTTVGNEAGQELPDIGAGRFSKRPFRYSFAVYEGYNSNVNTLNSGGVSSLYTEIAAGIGYDFGGSRLQLNVDLGAALTFYYNNKELQNDGLFPTINLIVGANYAASERLDLSFSTATSLLSQPNFTVAGSPNTDQGEYIISDTSFGAKYLWLPKLATETTYRPLIFYYLDPGAQTTDFSRVEQTVGQQFLFLWKPTTSLVAEYRFNTRNYFVAKNYDSIGNFALLGFDHTLNPRSTLTFRGGAEQRINQNPDTTGTNNYIGPFGELNFNYALGRDTTLGLQTRYGTTASGLTNYNQGQQLLFGLDAAHQLTRRIGLNAFLNYQNNYYTQPDSTQPNFYDNVFNTGLNASFKVNRVWSLLAGYTFTTLISTNEQQQKDYTQNIVYIGTEIDF